MGVCEINFILKFVATKNALLQSCLVFIFFFKYSQKMCTGTLSTLSSGNYQRTKCNACFNPDNLN